MTERLDAQDGEVCENLFFLGKRAITKTSEGLRIINLGGVLDASVTAGLSKDNYLPYHTEGDAKALHGANHADLLVTFSWPASIQNNSRLLQQMPLREVSGEQCLADLCSALKPRYHLSSSEIFCEREPFLHLSSEGQPERASITRFISLAPCNNSAGQKWLYAFTLDPSVAAASAPSPGVTACPFTSSNKRRLNSSDGTKSDFRFSKESRGRDDHRPSKRSRKKGPPPGPKDCFFCLSNPNIASHLVTSIGDESYVTTAKGPLSMVDTFKSLDFPAHMLIIPLAHTSTLGGDLKSESGVSSYKEMMQYQHALEAMIASCSKNALGVVTWELARVGGIHVHWQVLPISADLIRRGLVEAGFQVEAENEGYPTFTTRSIGDGSGEGTDYFRVWIWEPGSPSLASTSSESTPRGNEKEMVMPLPTDARFDLQFGRRVMAKMLGLESRLHWRDCAQSEDDEKKDAEAFKRSFKEFDFSL